MFTVNFNTFLKAVLPQFLRKVIMLALSNTLGQVLQQVNVLFVDFTEDTTDTFNITGHKIYLEKYLNDLYDPILRGIFIDNQEKAGFFYIRNKIEQRPALILYNKSEAQPSPFLNNKTELFGDFEYIIFIPVAVTFTTTILRKQVNQYNPAGRRYDITTY